MTFHACLGATCSTIFANTLRTDECQVVLLGNGPLKVAHDQEHKMAITIPASKIDLVLQGLKDTQGTSYNYPVPVFLDYEFESSYERLYYLEEIILDLKRFTELI